MNRKCNICNKPIILVPSAAERTKKYGGTPKSYTDLFTSHTECFIAKRNADTVSLMRKISK